MDDYAEAFLNLARIAGFNMESVDAYTSSLKEMGLVEKCKVNRLAGRKVKFIVEKCSLAPLIHKTSKFVWLHG